MSIREKFFQAMRREKGGFVPFEFSLCPSLYEEFKRRTGAEDYAEYYNFPARVLWLQFTGNKEKYRAFYPPGSDFYLDGWGVGYKSGSVAHFTEMQHPMAGFSSRAEFESYPYPDPDKDYDLGSLPQRVRELKNRDLIAVAGMECTIFEISWYLRGMDNFMVDMALNPDLAVCLLDHIEKISCKFACYYASAGFDVLRLGDDVSTQLDMMMSPAMWREFIKPRLAAVINAARSVKPDILIFYHGDGNLQKIIPDLIGIGVDILNPVQPECMDPLEIKKQYGDRLSFWGTIGTQTTMPFGTPAEVKEYCRKMIREVGKGGGLFLAPTHVLEPEVTWENIEVFINVVREYNETGV
ncbi:MAG: uroporphyrinogen decarboxylase family protein [Bacillota bacterium]